MTQRRRTNTAFWIGAVVLAGMSSTALALAATRGAPPIAQAPSPSPTPAPTPRPAPTPPLPPPPAPGPTPTPGPSPNPMPGPPPHHVMGTAQN